MSPWDPQTTNVPYLGWAGEEIRLEKCLPIGPSIDTSKVDLGGIRANYLVEDWSGTSSNPNLGPQIEPSTVKLFFADGNFCAAGDAVSLYPGMARIELDIVGNTGQIGYDPADPVLKHQFLAGWMTLNTPTLTELSASSFPSTAQANAAKMLGDPTGNGEFSAGGNPGLLSVKVSGSMPMTGAWASLLGTSSVTLPNDWALLASKLATDSNPLDSQAAAAAKWDIMNDPTGDFGHVMQTPKDCLAPGPQTVGAPPAPAGTDSVDNCTNGGADGPFSTNFGVLSSSNAVGPFDPVRASDTLLPNGVLNANDAPMPAARIDVTIAPNSGSSTDTSGVGSLVAADKTQTYSRDFLGDKLNNNEYAPYYDQYIPATSAGAVSSGVDGAYVANNFNGFLWWGKYHNWQIAASLASNTGTATSCLERASGNPALDSPTTHPGDYYQTPSGNSSVAVYTDNHGEAQVQYVPGTGFYFDSLIANGGAIVNADGGCDLQSLYQVPDSLGTAAITATARYPFKPTDWADMSSNTVMKSVTSMWSKTLGYDPKGAGAANNNSRIVIAHGQNIDGTPFAGETVCFSSNGESMNVFQGTVQTPSGPLTVTGAPAKDPTGASFGRVCAKTDKNGNAAVEVLESNPVTVDVIADFTAEGILRDVMVNYAPGSPGTGGTQPPAPSSTPTPAPAPAPSGGSNTGTTEPSAAIIKQVAPQLLGSKPVVKSTKSRITLARLISPAHRPHYLLVDVKSKSKRVRLHVRLVLKGKHHRTITRVVTVRTNRKVRIKLSSSVLRVAGVKLG